MSGREDERTQKPHVQTGCRTTQDPYHTSRHHEHFPWGKPVAARTLKVTPSNSDVKNAWIFIFTHSTRGAWTQGPLLTFTFIKAPLNGKIHKRKNLCCYLVHLWIIPWNRVIQKLIPLDWSKNPPRFIEPNVYYRVHKDVTVPYSEPRKSSPHPQIIYSIIRLSIILTPISFICYMAYPL